MVKKLGHLIAKFGNLCKNCCGPPYGSGAACVNCSTTTPDTMLVTFSGGQAIQGKCPCHVPPTPTSTWYDSADIDGVSVCCHRNAQLVFGTSPTNSGPCYWYGWIDIDLVSTHDASDCVAVTATTTKLEVHIYAVPDSSGSGWHWVVRANTNASTGGGIWYYVPYTEKPIGSVPFDCTTPFSVTVPTAGCAALVAGLQAWDNLTATITPGGC